MGTVQYSTVQYSTVQYCTVQYSTVQYSEHSTVLLHHVLPLCVHTGGKSAYCVPGKQHTDISDTGFSVLSEKKKMWALRAHPSSSCGGLRVGCSCCGALQAPWG